MAKRVDLIEGIDRDRICQYCGAPFLSKSPLQKFCDATCNRAYRLREANKKKIPKLCKHCGKGFRTDRQATVFCSRKCSGEFAHKTPDVFL